MEICCSFKSFTGGTVGYSYCEDLCCISQAVPCVVVKNTFQVWGDPETEVDLTLLRACIFKMSKDMDDFTICPTHRSNLVTSVGWSCGSISSYRVPKVYGRGKGRVKLIPKADWEIGKCVPQIVHMMSRKFILPPCAKLRIPREVRSRLGIGQYPPCQHLTTHF